MTITFTFAPGAIIFASRFNTNFSDVKNWADAHELLNAAVHGITGNFVDTGSVQTIAGAKNFTAVTTFASGTVLLPSITFQADPLTGMYLGGVSVLDFTVNATKFLQMDNAGGAFRSTFLSELAIPAAKKFGLNIALTSWITEASATTVEIGAATTGTLYVQAGSVGVNYSNPSALPAAYNWLVVGAGNNTNLGMAIYCSNTKQGNLVFTNDGVTASGAITYDHASNILGLTASSITRFSITSSLAILTTPLQLTSGNEIILDGGDASRTSIRESAAGVTTFKQDGNDRVKIHPNGEIEGTAVDPPTANYMNSNGVIRLWARVTSAGALTGNNYNVTAASKVSAGYYSVTVDTDFNAADYVISAHVEGKNFVVGTNALCARVFPDAAGSLIVQTFVFDSATGAVTQADCNFCVMAIGLQ